MSSKKTLYFIRHAQSEENVLIQSFLVGWRRVKHLEGLPTWQSCSDGAKLVKSGRDGPISDFGRAQIIALHEWIVKTDFQNTAQIEKIAHSPLKRAEETCAGVFEGFTCPREGLDCLKEQSPKEFISKTAFVERLEAFVEWLVAQPEQTMAIVGHSRHFRRLLDSESLMRNTEMWRVEFDPATRQFQFMEEVYNPPESIATDGTSAPESVASQEGVDGKKDVTETAEEGVCGHNAIEPTGKDCLHI